ncbi:MAG: phosphomannomutase/phosphoglucomutase [Candidatus Uhrbacteria bacterium]|nr:phosphomannomutase/phosphoglucomutase [Candidatus Uhrbacteria bacterium]
MEIPKHIFRAYDIRGLLEEVTVDIARVVGMALVSKTGAKTVIVGRDMRATSPELEAAAIEGITSMGANVIQIGLCSTSMFNFAVSSQEHIDAGLMVTASHNPPEFNGIKMALGSGLPISGLEILEEIQKCIVAGDVQKGMVTEQDILSVYIDKCIAVENLPDLSGTKLVIDYGNGMGAMSVRELCKRLKIEVVELYPEPDARFPNHEANPAKEETLADVKAAVVREGADFGIALDGDADRVGFIDNKGESLRGDLTLAVLSKEVLARKPGSKIVVAPNQSWTTFESIEQNGGVALECRIGRKFVVEAVQKQGAVLGGEVSSHFFFEEFHGLEAVDHAIVRMLSIWKQSGLSFADMVKPYRAYTNSGEVNIEIHNKEQVLNKLEQYASSATKVNKLDGIRAEFDHDWWFIVRPSNTEPLLRLIVEAKTPELMEEKRDELVALIKETG